MSIIAQLVCLGDMVAYATRVPGVCRACVTCPSQHGSTSGCVLMCPSQHGSTSGCVLMCPSQHATMS